MQLSQRKFRFHDLFSENFHDSQGWHRRFDTSLPISSPKDFFFWGGWGEGEKYIFKIAFLYHISMHCFVLPSQ